MGSEALPDRRHVCSDHGTFSPRALIMASGGRYFCTVRNTLKTSDSRQEIPRVIQDYCYVFLFSAVGPQQKQDYKDNRAYGADGIKTPLLAVRPNRKTAHQSYQYKNRKNKHHQHVFVPPSCFAGAKLILFPFRNYSIRNPGYIEGLWDCVFLKGAKSRAYKPPGSSPAEYRKATKSSQQERAPGPMNFAKASTVQPQFPKCRKQPTKLLVLYRASENQSSAQMGWERG